MTRVARDLRWRQADGVRRWAKLNARQIGLLQTIAVGEGDLREAWSEVAPSALALQNRGLVNSQGPLARGGLSSPTGGGSTSNTVTIPTDPATACRALAPRRGLRMGEPSAREMSTALRQAVCPTRSLSHRRQSHPAAGVHPHHRPRAPRRRRVPGGVAQQRERRGRSGTQRRMGHTASAARPAPGQPRLGLIPISRVGGPTRTLRTRPIPRSAVILLAA